MAGNTHFLLRWNLFFKRYTRALSIFNFGKSTGDFHDCLCLDNNATLNILVLKCYCSFM